MSGSRRQVALLIAGALGLAAAGVALWLDVRRAPSADVATGSNEPHHDRATPAPVLATDAGSADTAEQSRRITGSVKLYGKPLPNVDVGVATRQSWLVKLEHPARTDAAGRFSFDAATDKLEISVAGYDLDPAAFVDPGTAPVELALTVVDQAEISGRIMFHGAPVALGQAFLPGGPFADADPDGAYHLRGIKPGAHMIAAFDRATGRRSAWRAVTVGIGEHVAAIDIALEATPLLDVEVVDRDGRPMPRSLVRAQVAGGQELFRYTRDDGHAQFAVAEGDVEVGVSFAWNKQLDTSRTVVAQPGDTALPVRLVVPGRAGRTIRGTVHTADHQPASVAVAIAGESVHTDSHGRFVATDLMEGSYDVQFVAATRLLERKGVATDTAIDVVLPAPSSIDIKTEGFGDRCEADIQPMFAGMSSKFSHFDCRAGSFTAGELGAGRYAVSVEGTNGFARTLLELAVGETVHKTLTAARGMTVKGVARSFLGGTPIAGLSCRNGHASVVTDAAGAFAFANVPPQPQVIYCDITVGSRRLLAERWLPELDGDKTIELPVVEIGAPASDHTLGAQLSFSTGSLLFKVVDEGGPAATAGILVGDQVVTVAGRSAEGDDAEAARLYLTTRSRGSSIDLSIRSKGAGYVVPITIQIPP